MAGPAAQVASLYPALAPYLDKVAIVKAPASAPFGLEFYGPQEPANPVPGKPTIAAKAGTSATGIAGDLVSHYLARGVDPTLTHAYTRFVKSLTPDQHQHLMSQYAWAKAKEGETRPFAEWARVSGIPAYFRGYTFAQWSPANRPPDDQTSPVDLYTRPQLAQANQLIGYMTGQPAYGFGR